MRTANINVSGALLFSKNPSFKLPAFIAKAIAFPGNEIHETDYIDSGDLSGIRNPILASYATKILPYRGLGSGIIRALKAYPDIDFENDHDGNLFKVTIKRRSING